MKRLIPLIKICVSIGLIILLLKIVNLERLKEILLGINPVYLILSIVVMFTVITLAAYRWRLCLLAQGIDISIGHSLHYSLIGFFFNNFTPSTVGGDIAKGVIVSRFSKKKMGTVISILMDRLIGLLATGILAIFALLISFNISVDKRIRLVIVLFASIVVIMLFLLFNKNVTYKLASFLTRIRFQNLAQKITSVSDSFYIYRTYPGFIKMALLLSLILQMGNIFISYLLALGLDIRLSFLYFIVIIPLIMAVMAIPVSLNGLGLREGAFVVFFTLVGISKERAMAISISYYMVMLALSLMGGILLLYSNFSTKKR